jgi:hypothetical protein
LVQRQRQRQQKPAAKASSKSQQQAASSKSQQQAASSKQQAASSKQQAASSKQQQQQPGEGRSSAAGTGQPEISIAYGKVPNTAEVTGSSLGAWYISRSIGQMSGLWREAGDELHRWLGV